MKKVSIVVPVYNVEKYLGVCLDSIINQTYSNLEIILVNDGSTDNSGKICNEYAKNDKRIKLINRENGGLSAARNTGIDSASGEYLFFIDSDDSMDIHTIEMLVNAAEKSGSKIAAGSFENVYSKDHSLGPKPYGTPYTVLKRDSFFLQDITNHAWGKLYSADIFIKKNIRYPEGRNYEDIPTTFKAFLEVESFAYVDYPFYKYYIRQSSISQTFSKKNFEDMLWAYFYVDNYLKKYGHTDAVYQYYLLTILYAVDRLTYYMPQSEQEFVLLQRRKIRKEFNAHSSKVDLKKYYSRLQTLKLAAYKYHVSELVQNIKKVVRNHG